MKKNKLPWPLWMGIYGFRFVSHGEWSDPEIIWHGYAMNMHEVEDPMWALFCEVCDETGLEQSEENFMAFCKKEVWRMREYAQMAIDCGQAYKVKRVSFKTLLFSKNAPTLIAVPAK